MTQNNNCIIDEYINNCIDKIKANKNFSELLEIRKYEFHSCLYFIRHILVQCCDCLIMQNNIAAITISNLLLEVTLKRTIESLNTTCNKDIECSISQQNKNIKAFDDNDMSENIKYLYDHNYIDIKEKELLNTIRREFRNRFSHGSFAKTYKDNAFIHAIPEIYTIITYKEVDKEAFQMFKTTFGFIKKFDELLSYKHIL